MTLREIDAAVWAHSEEVLTNPEAIALKLAMLEQQDPTSADPEAVDRLLADVTRRQANLTRRVGLVEDDEAAAPLVADVNRSWQQKRQIEAERAAILRRRGEWEAARLRLTDLQAWCRSVATRPEGFSYDRKRLALDTWRVNATGSRRDRQPRMLTTPGLLAGLRPARSPCARPCPRTCTRSGCW